jgi:hypothetical protein
MVTPAMTSSAQRLHIEKAEALLALARLRPQSPEREQAIGTLQAALDAARRQPASGEDQQVARAEAKAVQAEADREEKRRPYEADPLFMYLWRRRYGTREYRASNLVRYFDRKVAHLIGFETARINYAMLMELPDRLREHADRLKASRGGAPPPGVAEAQRSPAVAALMRPDANEGPDEAALRRRIEEIDAALAHDHQPVVANE